MKNIYLLGALLFGLNVNVQADDWMSRLPDRQLVSQVSIPGAHDSATGNGVSLATFSQCQDIDVASQWSAGIRAFDFRPIVKDDHLHINHGIAETNLRFDDALYLLRDSLIAHPTEFAVLHLLYASNYDKDKDTYVTMLRELLGRDDLKDYFVEFRRDLRVSDLRGKMLVLSRDQYASKPITGGFFQNWCGWLDWNAQTAGTIAGAGNSDDYRSKLYVQDYANTKEDEGGVATKVDAINKMLDFSTKHTTDDVSEVVWVFNFASAYPGGISTASGYRENATYTNAAIIDYLKTHEAGPTGVIMMDYAGVDKSPNVETGTYETKGKELIDSIIANNLKFQKRVSEKIYPTLQSRIERLFEKKDEAREEITTEYKDVAQDFEDDLIALEDTLNALKIEADSLYRNWLFTEDYGATDIYRDYLSLINKVVREAKEAQQQYEETVGVVSVETDDEEYYEIYSVTGERLEGLRKGCVNILKYNDGRVRKVRY